MEKNFLIVANWKANIGPIYNFSVPQNIEIAVAPSFPQISSIPTNFSRAAQDVSSFSAGSFTGEVPAEVLKTLGVKYCLVGHSERRKYRKETTEDINLKMENLIKQNIIPIICAQTLEEIPGNIKDYDGQQIFVMYEPFSAISKNGVYNPEQPEDIKQTIMAWQSHLPNGIKFLYGGSVNLENIGNITSNAQTLSGFVVGHASLDPQNFSSMINSISR